ncbi:unnamed protein product [Phytophthora lilii]|uniref:Unnamed protein product n=1 Tax=Phytophthora lilii TaxID=2077276 RepID=A0A9W6THL6_9STRA|nr:unnamed protein product [Phytophthora lilii]
MHGRVKSVEREKEQQKSDAQRQEDLSKVRAYHEVAGKVLAMKRQQLFEPGALPLTSHLLLLNPEFHVLWSYRRQTIDALAAKAEDPAAEMQELAKTELKLTLVRQKSQAKVAHLSYLLALCGDFLVRTRCNATPSRTRRGSSASGSLIADWET